MLLPILILLLVLSPVLLLTALLVRLSSPGPIFFIQPRIGFNNELIKVLKFRTMYADQSDIRAEQTTTAGCFSARSRMYCRSVPCWLGMLSIGIGTSIITLGMMSGTTPNIPYLASSSATRASAGQAGNGKPLQSDWFISAVRSWPWSVRVEFEPLSPGAMTLSNPFNSYGGSTTIATGNVECVVSATFTVRQRMSRSGW